VFAATHDIELTHLLEKEYANYHFREEVLDNDISFNYILNKGRATTRNAIKLLGIMGYDEDVIKKAEETATHFLETGEWRM
jgi:DNA mismatch repair ATPase MutS